MWGGMWGGRVCVYVHCGCTVWVRGQFMRVSSLLLPCGFQESYSGHQALQQVPLPDEPSFHLYHHHHHLIIILFVCVCMNGVIWVTHMCGGQKTSLWSQSSLGPSCVFWGLNSSCQVCAASASTCWAISPARHKIFKRNLPDTLSIAFWVFLSVHDYLSRICPNCIC